MPPESEVRLAVIGDIHAQWERLDAVLERLAREGPDGILLVGDLGSHDLSYVHRRTPARDQPRDGPGSRLLVRAADR